MTSWDDLERLEMAADPVRELRVQDWIRSDLFQMHCRKDDIPELTAIVLTQCQTVDKEIVRQTMAIVKELGAVAEDHETFEEKRRAAQEALANIMYVADVDISFGEVQSSNDQSGLDKLVMFKGLHRTRAEFLKHFLQIKDNRAGESASEEDNDEDDDKRQAKAVAFGKKKLVRLHRNVEEHVPCLAAPSQPIIKAAGLPDVTVRTKEESLRLIKMFAGVRRVPKLPTAENIEGPTGLKFFTLLATVGLDETNIKTAKAAVKKILKEFGVKRREATALLHGSNFMMRAAEDILSVEESNNITPEEAEEMIDCSRYFAERAGSMLATPAREIADALAEALQMPKFPDQMLPYVVQVDEYTTEQRIEIQEQIKNMAKIKEAIRKTTGALQKHVGGSPRTGRGGTGKDTRPSNKKGCLRFGAKCFHVQRGDPCPDFHNKRQQQWQGRGKGGQGKGGWAGKVGVSKWRRN